MGIHFSVLDRGHFEKLPVQNSGIHAAPLLHFTEENRLLRTQNNFGTIWSNFETAKFYIRFKACNLFVLCEYTLGALLTWVEVRESLFVLSGVLFCGTADCAQGGT